MHINVIWFYFKTYKSLYYVLVVNNCEFVNISLRMFELKSPIKQPAIFFSNVFKISLCNSGNVSRKTIPRDKVLIEFVNSSISKSNPIFARFFTVQRYLIRVLYPNCNLIAFMLLAVVISYLSGVFGDKHRLDAETRNALIITANGSLSNNH